MTQGVGVLAVRIWRSDQGEARVRVMAKLDVLDPHEAEVSYPGSVDEIEAVVGAWVRRYVAGPSSCTGEPAPPAG